jgi:hypothetical protein
MSGHSPALDPPINRIPSDSEMNGDFLDGNPGLDVGSAVCV